MCYYMSYFKKNNKKMPIPDTTTLRLPRTPSLASRRSKGARLSSGRRREATGRPNTSPYWGRTGCTIHPSKWRGGSVRVRKGGSLNRGIRESSVENSLWLLWVALPPVYFRPLQFGVAAKSIIICRHNAYSCIVWTLAGNVDWQSRGNTYTLLRVTICFTQYWLRH